MAEAARTGDGAAVRESGVRGPSLDASRAASGWREMTSIRSCKDVVLVFSSFGLLL